ncbi:NfeD family protein [uncultured Ruminococcus sp.]|jgi:membrane protein implicated in regulation of membrane protease activity|uniref:NfeD family protein n=1 Tax=uncultured Ruminococcus sp. TaxID=165186 RepID=UPI0025EA9517|nr:NfeD family protein [uncultured Ruminococcus sp.]
MEILFWALAVIAFVIAEVLTIQLVSIWFAAGAFVTLFATYFFELSWIQQLGVFIVASAVFLVMSLPLIRKRKKNRAVATNADLDVGRHATVIEEINCDKGTGRVTLSGVNWSAVPENENEVISEGTVVIVKKVMGAKLLVAPEK